MQNPAIEILGPSGQYALKAVVDHYRSTGDTHELVDLPETLVNRQLKRRPVGYRWVQRAGDFQEPAGHGSIHGRFGGNPRKTRSSAGQGSFDGPGIGEDAPSLGSGMLRRKKCSVERAFALPKNRGPRHKDRIALERLNLEVFAAFQDVTRRQNPIAGHPKTSPAAGLTVHRDRDQTKPIAPSHP